MKSTQQLMTYELESSLPLGILILLAMQHILIAIVDLAMPVLVVRSIGGTPAQTAWMCSAKTGFGFASRFSRKILGDEY